MLPEAFVRRVLLELGAADGEALCAALDTAPAVGVRLHPLRCAAIGELPNLTPGERIPWSPQGWSLAERPSFTLDTDFHAGAYYVQEPASQFVGHLLRTVATEGCRILDLCAAPGGKTTL